MRKSSDSPDACEERSQLWAYSTGELAPERRAQVARHLESCRQCRAEQEATTATREVLALASSFDSLEAASEPGDAAATEDRVPDAACRRRRAIIVVLGAVAGCCLLWFQLRSQPSPSAAVKPPGAARPAPVHVEPGQGALAGEVPARGRTGAALARFPDGSLAWIDAGAELRLERASPTELALSLVAGRVRLRASPAPRTGFTVSVGSARVRVIGGASEAIFGVAVDARTVDVSVSRGEVLLEGGDGAARLVVAGERVAADLTDWSVRVLGLGAADLAGLEALGSDDEALGSDGRHAAQPPDARTLQVVAGGPRPAPDRVEPGAPAAASSPADVSDRPPAPASTEGAQKAGRLETWIPQVSLDDAEKALSSDDCQRSMRALDEYCERAELPAHRERARILRARCFTRMRQLVYADAEYRLYLNEHPHGAFAGEARRVVAH